MVDDQVPKPTSPTRSGSRWFHFRWRTLLVIPLAIVVLGLVYGPRQYRQRQAVTALKARSAVVRTDPVTIPLLPELAGEEYAVEVREVYWRGPKTTDADLAILSGLDSLQKLELGAAPITDAGLVHLTGCGNLYTLHLSDTKVTDAGLATLTQLSNLSVLSLDRTAITNAGLTHLATMDKLERLYLNETEVTDEGLKHLGQLIGLRELSLNGTRITDAGIQSLHGLKRLELLKVNNTEVSKEGMLALHKALPRCQILIPGADE